MALLLLFVLMTLLIGPTLQASWLNGCFLGSLHWPVGGGDLAVGGVSYVELLILYELWAGERLSLEKAHPRYLRPGRPISVSAVPFGPGIDVWHSCRLVAAMMRSRCLLPGGLGRFVPCSIRANHCRLRQTGWERCGHGLTSRPRRVPLRVSWISFCCCFSTLLGLPYFHFGIVLLRLLVGFLLGLGLCLVMLLL